MARLILTVFTTPTEGREDEYNEWYNNTHLPDILHNVKGVVSAQRFHFNKVDDVESPSGRDYLAIYEFDLPDANAARAAMAEAAAAGLIPTDRSLYSGSGLAYFEPITERLTNS